MKVFLSAVSAQFKECRDALASDLRAIGCEVRVQEDFQQGPRSLIERLEEYVAECDRVVALVGDAYGYEAAGDAVPNVEPLRSYTQWEYFFTVGERRSGSRAAAKDLYLYFASERYLSDHPAQQQSEHAIRQRWFVEQLKASGKHYATFDTLDNVCRMVLRDGWQMAERPPKPANLPYGSLGRLFKGRDPFLDRLHRRLRNAPEGCPFVLCGLGGVGKTRLAVEYALLHQDEYSALLSVGATTAEALRAGIASLAGPAVLNLPEQAAKDQDIRIGAVLGWLGQRPGWLLILDNVDTQEAAQAVEEHLARLLHGHVVITSRINVWSGAIALLELDKLTEDDSAAFLMERTEGRRRATPTDAADSRELARQLDGLALALEQAGAFISAHQRQVSLADYLRRWRAHEKGVREWYDPRVMRYPCSVAVTWDTTVSQLDAGALFLLHLLSWLSPEPVPRALLQTDAARALLSGAHDEGAMPPAGPEDAIAALSAVSLLQWQTGADAFRIHRLVQEITRERLPTNERKDRLCDVLRLLDDYLPSDPPPEDVRSWPRWEPLRSHLAAVLREADSAQIAVPTARLMNNFGLLLLARCVWGEAERLLRRALAIDEASYGPYHPNVAVDLNNLANLLQDTNRMADAEPLLRRALAISEASLAPDNPRVASGLSNLATLLQDTNRMADAEPLMRRALAIDEASYGPNHPSVATRLSNLATLLQDTNRPAEAEPLLWRALAIDKASYGPDHPSVATRLNNLATLLKASNRLQEAEPLMRRALAIDEASYGRDHPGVGVDLGNLALLLKATNRLEEAEPLMRRALAIAEASYGPHHPKVAIGLSNLALLLRATNRLGQAEPLMRRALDIDEASHGTDHPAVARGLNNLAQLLQDTNRVADAEPLMRRALAIAEASYGPDHPTVAIALSNLALLLQATNRREEAKPLMQRALRQREP